jgi:peptidoglycan/LPS O-acetylase OafA/YrhL
MKFIYYASLCRLDELVAGAALALLKNAHAPLWKRMTQRGNLALLLGAALAATTFCLLLADERGLLMTVIGYPMLALSFALLIVAAVSEGSLLARTRVPGAAQLAAWSYATYLTHKQVCILANQALQPYGIGPGSAAGVAIMTAASILFGWLLYRLVEMPFMALRERWVPSHFANTPMPAAGVKA